MGPRADGRAAAPHEEAAPWKGALACMHAGGRRGRVVYGPFPSAWPAYFPPPPPAMARVAGTLSKSTECMQLVNSLLKIPDFQAVMRDMSKGWW